MCHFRSLQCICIHHCQCDSYIVHIFTTLLVRRDCCCPSVPDQLSHPIPSAPPSVSRLTFVGVEEKKSRPDAEQEELSKLVLVEPHVMPNRGPYPYVQPKRCDRSGAAVC